jgi:hypothetical protein
MDALGEQIKCAWNQGNIDSRKVKGPGFAAYIDACTYSSLILKPVQNCNDYPHFSVVTCAGELPEDPTVVSRLEAQSPASIMC